MYNSACQLFIHFLHIVYMQLQAFPYRSLTIHLRLSDENALSYILQVGNGVLLHFNYLSLSFILHSLHSDWQTQTTAEKYSALTLRVFDI